MSTASQLDKELLTRLLESDIQNNVANILNCIAKVLVQKTTFFDDDNDKWEEALLKIFRDQVSQERKRKDDEVMRRKIVKKKFEIMLLQKELQKHYTELNGLLNDVEPEVTDHKAIDQEITDHETTDFEVESSSSSSTNTRTNHRYRTKKIIRKCKSKTWRPMKDIFKPKRPRNAFLIWMMENRKQISMDNPQLKFSNVSKICGTMWDVLEDKSEWYTKAAEAQRQYREQLKRFNRLH